MVFGCLKIAVTTNDFLGQLAEWTKKKTEAENPSKERVL